uniref:Uncharacterized protein n=1 Tax=Zea mays TaxID=4577 RepID=A0A804Q6B1_MAIZE
MVTRVKVRTRTHPQTELWISPCPAPIPPRRVQLPSLPHHPCLLTSRSSLVLDSLHQPALPWGTTFHHHPFAADHALRDV